MEYSLTNTLFAKVRGAAAPAAAGPGRRDSRRRCRWSNPAATGGRTPTGDRRRRRAGHAADAGAADHDAGAALGQALAELHVRQRRGDHRGTQTFSAVEWEARTRPLTGLEITWRGNFDVYGKGVGLPECLALLEGRRRLAAGGLAHHARLRPGFPRPRRHLLLGRFDIQARSRYNLAETTFVENRINVKYSRSAGT